ncbi:MAG: YlbF family regulator [Akkermansia sp.]
MANTSLPPELVAHVTNLASAFAQNQKVISAKARIGLFYQNPAATDLFRRLNEYGEKLREKHQAGMSPSETELAEFDKLRAAVVGNELCKGFLEANQQMEEMIATVQQYLVLAIQKGCAPTDEEVAATLTQQVSCSCGGGCHGDCEDCDKDSCKHGEGECCSKHGEGECCGKHGEGECCGKHGEGECCGKHHHDEGACGCGKHGA